MREQPDQIRSNIPKNSLYKLRVGAELSGVTGPRRVRGKRKAETERELARGNKSQACRARQCGWAEVLGSK